MFKMDDYFKLCIHGHLQDKSSDQVETIIRQADIFSRDENGRTGLFLAAWNGHVHILQLIQRLHFNKDLPINTMDNFQFTPLEAAQSRYLMDAFGWSMLPLLLEEWTIPLPVEKSHFGCDGSDANSDWMACMNFLLNFPLIQADGFFTASFEACKQVTDNQAEKIYKLISLLALHPNITLTKSEVEGFVKIACWLDRPEYLALFITANEKHNTITFNSIIPGNVLNETVLGYCLLRRNEKCALWLLEQPDCDPSDIFKVTQREQKHCVFYLMCFNCLNRKWIDIDIFKKLLAHPKLNPTMVSIFGNSLIHIAAKKECAEYLDILLKNTNNDVNLLQTNPCANTSGIPNQTALQLAIQYISKDCTMVLLKDPRTHLPMPGNNQPQSLNIKYFRYPPATRLLLIAGYDSNLDAFAIQDSSRYHDCILNTADMFIDYVINLCQFRLEYFKTDIVTVTHMFHSAGARSKIPFVIKHSYLASINEDQMQMYNKMVGILKHPLSLKLLSRNALVSTLKAVHCPKGSLLAHSDKIQQGLNRRMPETLVELVLKFELKG